MPFVIIVQSAISAIVFVNVLTAPDGIFQHLRSLFLWLPDTIQHVIFGCAKCQSVYWFMLYSFLWVYFGDHILIGIVYGLFDTIFIAYMIGLTANKLSR